MWLSPSDLAAEVGTFTCKFNQPSKVGITTFIHTLIYTESSTMLALSQAVGETAWQLTQVQMVTSTDRELAAPVKFQNFI